MHTQNHEKVPTFPAIVPLLNIRNRRGMKKFPGAQFQEECTRQVHSQEASVCVCVCVCLCVCVCVHVFGGGGCPSIEQWENRFFQW